MSSTSLHIRLILLCMGICAVLNLAVLVILDQLHVQISYTINELIQLSIIMLCIILGMVVFFCLYRPTTRHELL